jgi:hypothetical protein
MSEVYSKKQLLSDVYNRKQLLPYVYRRKTAAVVRCVQQETTVVVRCVQQENSCCYQMCTTGNICCCQMCTAVKQIQLSDMYSSKTSTAVKQLQLSDMYSNISISKACLSFRQPFYLIPVSPISQSFYLLISVFLPICLSVSPSVLILSYGLMTLFNKACTHFSNLRILYLSAYSFCVAFSVSFHHKATSERHNKQMVHTGPVDQFSLLFSRNFVHLDARCVKVTGHHYILPGLVVIGAVLLSREAVWDEQGHLDCMHRDILTVCTGTS